MELSIEALKTVIDEANAAGLSVYVGVHNAPAGAMFDWLNRGLIGPIGEGAGGNPPTSSSDGRADDGHKLLDLTIYMDRGTVPVAPSYTGVDENLD